MLGIFKSGVMAGALVLLMLNRLQMLKESRGQQRPNREGRRRRGKVSTRRTPWGDTTVRRVTSVSFFQHKIAPLPFPSPTRRCVEAFPGSAPPTHPSLILSIPYLLNALIHFHFHLSPAPPHHSWPVWKSLHNSEQSHLCVWNTLEYIYWKHECK